MAGLGIYLVINDNSAKATPVAYVPGTPEALSKATLHLSDFPRLAEYSAGWTANDLVDRTVLGSIGIANAFTRCVRVRGALLGGFGPTSAASSPIFTSSFNTVENLVAVEPSVAGAVDVMAEIGRARSTSCVIHQLEIGWRQLNRASSTATNLVVTASSNDLPHLGNQSMSFSFFFSDRAHINIGFVVDDIVIIRQGPKDALLDYTGRVAPIAPKFEQSVDTAEASRLNALVINRVHKTTSSLGRSPLPHREVNRSSAEVLHLMVSLLRTEQTVRRVIGRQPRIPEWMSRGINKNRVLLRPEWIMVPADPWHQAVTRKF